MDSKNNPPVESKRCVACGQVKDKEFFYVAPRRPDGLRSWCKQCSSEKKRKKDNPSIYKITNVINGKVYIGQTWNTRKRWGDHKNQASEGSPDYIHRAMRKYKIESFAFEKLIIPCSQMCMNALESYFISLYDSTNSKKGYNLTTGGEGGKRGEEAKKRNSEAQLKRTTSPGYVHPMKGKKHSPESRAKMTRSRTGVSCPWNSTRQKELLLERGLEYYAAMGKLGAKARWDKK